MRGQVPKEPSSPPALVEEEHTVSQLNRIARRRPAADELEGGTRTAKPAVTRFVAIERGPRATGEFASPVSNIPADMPAQPNWSANSKAKPRKLR